MISIKCFVFVFVFAPSRKMSDEAPSPRRGIKRRSSIPTYQLQMESIQEEAEQNKILLSSDNKCKFFKLKPLMSHQIYRRVTDILGHLLPVSESMENLKTVMDVGCGKYPMHVHLRQMQSVGKIIYLDLDENMMKWNADKLSHFMYTSRVSPLRVEAYSGCITKVDPNVLNSSRPVFAVLAIEVIDDLDPDTLNGFIKSVFGTISPFTVIITMAHIEFNGCNLSPAEIENNKFGWSRQKFESWCNRILEMYPIYTYNYTTEGIGVGQAKTGEFGCMSQIVIFRKNTCPQFEGNYQNGQLNEAAQDSQHHHQYKYKLIAKEDYPYDSSTLNNRIISEFESYIWTKALSPQQIEDYNQDGVPEIRLPLIRVRQIYGIPRDISMEKLGDILATKYKVLCEDENGPQAVVVVPVPDGSSHQVMDVHDGGIEYAPNFISQSSSQTSSVDENWD